VARGGLRWSDRRDDFRTEILGLMKAQRVKNAVIVPTGAKGGFYPKQLPNPAIDREAWAAEGRGSYETFIRTLLSVTDNIVDDKVVHPRDVVITDGEDPYFVVAADKGTATFSDIANGLAAGSITNLMTELGLHYQNVQGGLNAEHQGSYLFSGGRGDVAPATAKTMADLAAAPSTASTFANDSLKQKSRIDENTLVETGFVASELGGGLTDVFRTIQSYQNGNAVVIDGVTYTPAAPGSITGKPTAEVEAFLKATLKALDAANTEVTNQTAKNGLVQNQVKSALDAHESQKIALEKLMNDKTGYDPAQAVTDLQMAQVAIQASAQVINTLRSTSLLDLLR